MPKKMSINIEPDQVVYSQISKSQDGYNSARMVVKSGEKEYMAISYEWEGEGVPDFVMGMMGFMQANHIELSSADEWVRPEEAEEEEGGAGSQVHCKNCKKTKDKCDCGMWQPVPYKTKDQKENKTK